MSQQVSSAPALVMRQGPRPNSAFVLNKALITIGRTPDNDLVLDDFAVSRNHARLFRSGDAWVVEDLNSANGTFVNGQRISGPATLSPGAQVGFGPNIVFSLQAPPPPPPPGVSGSTQVMPRGRGGSPCMLALIAAAILVLLPVVAGLAAYLVASRRLGGPSLTALAAGARGPDVALQEPANNTLVKLGQEVLVFALARDAKGVTHMELWVDGQVVTELDSQTPAGLTPLSLVHTWVPTEPGEKWLLVRAYNSQGAMGSSPIVYLTVLDEPAETPLGQYVVQPGDTLLGLVEALSITLPALQEANPALGDVITEGQTIVVPIPTVEMPTPTPTLPAPPPSPSPLPPPPPGGPPNAPTLISAAPADCTVTLTWQDNSDNELGFLVYRAVSGAPTFSLLPTTAGPQPGVGNLVNYPDQVPYPDDYIYYVAAANPAGPSPSNLVAANVPPSGACVQPTGYKQLMFQPLIVQPTNPGYSSMALFYSIAGSVFRRVPPTAGDSLPVGDWSAIEQAAPAPASAFVDPAQPVLAGATGLAWPGADNVGFFERPHLPAQMLPTTIWHGQGMSSDPLKSFDLYYRFWMQNVTWGEGSTNLIPPPVNLRIATTVAELNKLWYCATHTCDPLADRALVWDWTGDPATIDGYMLYRMYSCPGQDGATPAPDAVHKTSGQGKFVPAWTVPSGCAARYQVSAFGPAGESAPSEPLDIPATAPLVNLPVTFENLTISGIPGGAFRRVVLTANQYHLQSLSVYYANGVAKDLSNLVFNGKVPNNALDVPLGPGDALQLHLEVVDPATMLSIHTEHLTFPPPPGNDWGPQVGTHHLDATAAYDLAVAIGAPTTLAIGETARPKANLAYVPIVPVGVSGLDIYVRMYNAGPDDLFGTKVQVTTWWIDPITTLPVNTQTFVRTFTAHGYDEWVFKADSVPPVYASLSPLPVFHVEWAPVDFDYIGTASTALEMSPLEY